VRRALAACAATALIVAACGGGDDARTFYESLDLDTPLAAVETFTDAFADDDFMTVWLVLDPEAQFRVQQELNLLQYQALIGPEAMDDLAVWFDDESFFESMEHSDPWYFFDQIMLIADANNGLLIDLSGNAKVQSDNASGNVATVVTEVDGIEGDVVFRLEATPTGRWRVKQVIVPGGDPELLPWSVPSGAS